MIFYQKNVRVLAMNLKGVNIMKIQINSDSAWSDDFLNRIEEDGPWGNWDLYKLAIEVEKTSSHS